MEARGNLPIGTPVLVSAVLGEIFFLFSGGSQTENEEKSHQNNTDSKGV